VPSTLQVTNLSDSGKGSLRYEIAQAHSNDTITFNPKLDGGTIQLWSRDELSIIGKNLTIKGPGAGLLTVSSPFVNTARIFEVSAAAVTLSGLTISNGGGLANASFPSPNDGDGGAVLNDPDGVLTISGCTLSDNSAAYGGAIYNFGTLTVSGCTLSKNSVSAVGNGGGIYNANALTVSGSTLSGNSAYDGGGIYNAGTLTVSGSTLSGNSAGSDGGGIYTFGPAATVSSTTLSGNTAGYGGGGIYNAWTLTVSNSTFSGNTPDNIEGPYTDGGGNTFK
jgi:hypothetical protein